MKRSYVYLQGELWEIGVDNIAIIHGEKWACFSGRWSPIGAAPGTGPMIMPDIKPYQSMIDGSIIESRSVHRAHLREHGCIEVGNERLPPPRREWTATKGLREELISRINS